jgi:hypothetical protein
MKTILKIVIGLAVVTACFNASRAALTDYQFQDEVQQALLFDPRASEEEIIALVMKKGAEYEIPITEDGIKVHMVGQDVRAEMTYTKSVVLVPGVFSKEWTFTPKASARILVGAPRR